MAYLNESFDEPFNEMIGMVGSAKVAEPVEDEAMPVYATQPDHQSGRSPISNMPADLKKKLLFGGAGTFLFLALVGGFVASRPKQVEPTAIDVLNEAQNQEAVLRREFQQEIAAWDYRPVPQEPGELQKAVLNLSTDLEPVIAAQVNDPEHPCATQTGIRSVEVCASRAIIMNRYEAEMRHALTGTQFVLSQRMPDGSVVPVRDLQESEMVGLSYLNIMALNDVGKGFAFNYDLNPAKTITLFNAQSQAKFRRLAIEGKADLTSANEFLQTQFGVSGEQE